MYREMNLIKTCFACSELQYAIVTYAARIYNLGMKQLA